MSEQRKFEKTVGGAGANTATFAFALVSVGLISGAQPLAAQTVIDESLNLPGTAAVSTMIASDEDTPILIAFGTTASLRQGLSGDALDRRAFGLDQLSRFDEAFAYLRSPLGEIRVGRTPGAAVALGTEVPSAARSRGFYLTDFGPRTDGATNRLTIGPGTSFGGGFGTANSFAGNAEKVVYFTPRLAGVELGISWAADLDANESLRPIDQGPVALDIDGVSALEVGANYIGEFGGLRLSLSGSYLRAAQSGNPVVVARYDGLALARLEQAVATRTSLGGGGAIGYAGFSIGASWLRERGGMFDNSLGALNGFGEYEAWEVGLMYDSGSWAVSLGYGAADQQIGEAGQTEFFARDSIDLYEISASYRVLPWLDLSTGLQWFDYEAEALLSGETGVETDDAAVLFMGTSVRF